MIASSGRWYSFGPYAAHARQYANTRIWVGVWASTAHYIRSAESVRGKERPARSGESPSLWFRTIHRPGGRFWANRPHLRLRLYWSWSRYGVGEL